MTRQHSISIYVIFKRFLIEMCLNMNLVLSILENIGL